MPTLFDVAVERLRVGQPISDLLELDPRIALVHTRAGVSLLSAAHAYGRQYSAAEIIFTLARQPNFTWL